MYARRDSIVRSDERSVNNIKSILDLKPRNKQIINYCKSLINVRIFGQKETDYPSENSLQENELTLSYFIQSADAFLRSFGNNTEITGHEEEFIYYMQGLLETRGLKNPQRFVTDVKKFLEIYIKRGCPSDRLNHSDYWGSRQQLLAGKVISDFVGEDYGPLDPVFGVLLCPVAAHLNNWNFLEATLIIKMVEWMPRQIKISISITCIFKTKKTLSQKIVTESSLLQIMFVN
ncbi:uncharacterized protein LOC101236484 isoform X4 [Hydra vulgaris]|uniref:Uncharacterized protein LOC101236484 isoform X4 n=1 Tax=Hydra vulgaris TaxID=6087 RepID=A0ABM4DG91_HYDVU